MTEHEQALALMGVLLVIVFYGAVWKVWVLQSEFHRDIGIFNVVKQPASPAEQSENAAIIRAKAALGKTA